MSNYGRLFVLVVVLLSGMWVRPVAANAVPEGLVVQSPRAGGTQITWAPTGTDNNIELMFVVINGATPSLTVVRQSQTIDTNTLPIVDDHVGLNNRAVVLGQVVKARGQTLVGVIIQPRFYDALGIPQRLTQITFNVNDVTYAGDVQSLTNSRPFLRSSVTPRQYWANEWRVVTRSGWQRLRGSDLIAAGLPQRSRYLVNLELRQGNTVIPLLLDGLEDYRIDTNDEVVFYAPPVTSRWQQTQTFWLRIGNGAGRIFTQTYPPVVVTPSTQALEVVTVRTPTTYEPLVAGTRREYWFSQRLRLDSSMGAEALALKPTWRAPVVAGDNAQVRASVRGYTYEETAGPHTITLNDVETMWEGVGSWQYTLTDRSDALNLSFRSNGISEVLIESVEFGRMAEIIPNVEYDIAEEGWYRPNASTPISILNRVFDITDPMAPILMRNVYQPGLFEITETNRRVIVLGPNAYQRPTMARALRPVWSVTGADAIYIAPAKLLPALAPLIKYRNSQRIATVAFDVQQIYDGWSNGDVDPNAIRAFLQYVAHRWQRVPHTVILVGDGTVDPLNYTKSGGANVNHIPPYLAEVDAYLGESACDSCYVRLDGDNPLTDAAPDMAIGRISVRTASELSSYIEKIWRYEAQPLVRWTNQHILAADNPDSGGDFPYFANTIQRSAHLTGLRTQQFLYDPNVESKYSGVRIRSAATLRADFLKAINAGAGLVTYVGHANHYQWASTDFAVDKPYLMNIWDVDGLTNGNMTPIMVSMACLSSAFQRESTIGQTIDERLVFKSTGGAIATWGSAGMEVASGHNQMFYNFYRVLRDNNQRLRTLGSATFIGSVYLAASSTCCANVISAYTLIGDPLIRPRITLASTRASMDELPDETITEMLIGDAPSEPVQIVDERLLPTPATLPTQP